MRAIRDRLVVRSNVRVVIGRMGKVHELCQRAVALSFEGMSHAGSGYPVTRPCRVYRMRRWQQSREPRGARGSDGGHESEGMAW